MKNLEALGLFASFFRELDTQFPVVFDFQMPLWIEQLPDPEDRIFAHFTDAVTAPKNRDDDSNYRVLEGWSKLVDENSQGKLRSYVSQRLHRIRVGGYPGAHRKPSHRDALPELLDGYLKLTGNSQRRFYTSGDFESLFISLDDLPSIGPLTAFDILERVYRANFTSSGPKRLVVTGGGMKDGLKRIADHSNTTIEKAPGELLERVCSKLSSRDRSLTVFDLETLLCCYRKEPIRSKADQFLKENLPPEEFAESYAHFFEPELPFGVTPGRNER